MVGLEVVDLLLEDEGPQVLAEELDHVKGIVEAGAVAGESIVGTRREEMIRNHPHDVSERGRDGASG